MKTYYTQNNVGKAKYVVNIHDGVKTHKDGSRFYDVRIFNNRIKLTEFINQLRLEGYVN